MFSILLAVPSCIYNFWYGVIPTSYFIFNEFYTYFTNFYAGLALTSMRRDDNLPVHVRICMRLSDRPIAGMALGLLSLV